MRPTDWIRGGEKVVPDTCFILFDIVGHQDAKAQLDNSAVSGTIQTFEALSNSVQDIDDVRLYRTTLTNDIGCERSPFTDITRSCY